MGTPARPNKTINAVEMSIDILGALQELEGAGVTEIAEHVGTTKATVHNHLRTLEEEDIVVREADGQYDVGLRILDLAHYAKSRFPISEFVEDEIDKLAAKSGEMALFTVEEHWKGVTLYVAFGEKSIQTPIYIGNREPLHNTAVGKAILAHKSDDELEEFLETEGLKSVTEQTITDREEFKAELERVREHGYATNDEEDLLGIRAVGSPIFSPDGEVLGALSVSAPASRLQGDRFTEDLPRIVKEYVNIIEVNLQTGDVSV